MFENIINFLKKFTKKEEKVATNSRDAAKERLHLVLMQDRANVSADFLELMKQEIIEVIKKYIDIDESAIDVRLTNKENEDGTNGAPALYANIPIVNIKNDARKVDEKEEDKNKTEKIVKKSNNKKNTEEIQNERIAKVIIDGKIDDKEKSNIKEENKEKKDEIVIDNGEEDKKEKQLENNLPNKEEKVEKSKEIEDTKEELKSEN